MAKHHSPRERVQLFRMGWVRGAGMKAIPDNVKDDPDFQNGYREGRIAFSEAMRIAREHYGAPPPSILRTGEAIEHDITPSAEAEMKRDPRTAANMKGGPDHREDDGIVKS